MTVGLGALLELRLTGCDKDLCVEMKHSSTWCLWWCVIQPLRRTCCPVSMVTQFCVSFAQFLAQGFTATEHYRPGEFSLLVDLSEESAFLHQALFLLDNLMSTLISIWTRYSAKRTYFLSNSNYGNEISPKTYYSLESLYRSATGTQDRGKCPSTCQKGVEMQYISTSHLPAN